MKKYSSYKDTGVEWIGEIPDHWKELKLRRIGILYGGLTGKSGDDFRSENNPKNKPYIPYTNIFNNTYISKEHFDYVVIEEDESQNRVQKFDLFFLMSSETYEDLGTSSILIEDVDELYLNSFCKGFRIEKDYVYPLFLNYLLLGDTHKKLISIEGEGFTRINLRQSRLKNIPLVIPPLPEQIKIVSYLDNKTSKVDCLIQSKQRKIELLKEKRTSLINEVVTKGLNPDVEMKDSGVEWIGEIPSHWESVKIKYLGSVKSGDGLKSSLIEKKGEFPVYGGNGIMGYYSEFNFEEEILIIGRVGEKCGNVHFENNKVWVNDNSLVFNPYTNKNSIQYLFYSFKTRDLNKLSSKNTQPLITGTSVKDEKIPLPSLTEQKEIVDYIDSETQTIDKTVNLEKVKIDLLKEYKQSLISEVVTGKVNVQEEVNEVLV